MNALNFFKNIILLALVLSLPRFYQIWIHHDHFQGLQDILLNAFLGLRFDLLVLSFSFLPIWFLRTFNIKQKTNYINAINIYSRIIFFFFACVYFLNFISLEVNQDLIWSQNWVQIPELLLKSTWTLTGSSFVFAILIYFGGLHFFKNLRRNMMAAKLSSLVGILFLLAFFARGSLGYDHLRRNDCDGRKSPVVRALCLNPLYVAFKIKNHEFGP